MKPAETLTSAELQARLEHLDGRLSARSAAIWEELQALCSEAQARGFAPLQAYALVLMGNMGYLEKRLPVALEYYQQGLGMAQQLSDWPLEARALNGLGLLAQERGEYRQALQYFTSSLEIVQEFQDWGGIARALNNIAILWTRLGQPERALEYMGRAQDLLLSFQHPAHTFVVALNLIWVNIEVEHFDRAYAICNLYQSLAVQKNPEYEVEILAAKANCQAHMGLVSEAENNLQETLKLVAAHPEMTNISSALLLLARTRLVAGQQKEALELFEKTIAMARLSDTPDMLIAAQKEIAQLYSKLGEYQKAYEHSWEYFAVYQRMFPVDMDMPESFLPLAAHQKERIKP